MGEGSQAHKRTVQADSLWLLILPSLQSDPHRGPASPLRPTYPPLTGPLQRNAFTLVIAY